MKTLAAAMIVLAAAPLLAETPGGNDDPVSRYLFAPEKVLGASKEIGLDDAQKKALRAEITRAQGKFLDLQFDMKDKADRLAALLQEEPVDETKSLRELDDLLTTEREVKHVQISLLIRIKNILTPAQEKKLAEIQK